MQDWKVAMLVAFAAGMLGGCQNPVDTFVPPNADEQTDAASRVYVGCLQQAADRYDDTKTPIDEVVTKVSSQCTGEYSALKNSYARNLSGNALQSFEADMDANQPSGVRDVVMHRRQLRSQAAAANGNGPG